MSTIPGHGRSRVARRSAQRRAVWCALAAAALVAPASAASGPDGERVVPQIAHVHEILDLAFAPDGTFVVTGGADGKVKLWTPDGRLLRTLPSPALRARVVVAPGGGLLAVGGRGGEVTLYTNLGERRARLETPVKPSPGFRDFAFAPDGAWLVACAEADHEACARYASLDGRALATFALPADAHGVVAVSVAPDGETLYTAGGHALIAWSTEGQLRWRADTGRGFIQAMTVARDGTIALVVGAVEEALLGITRQPPPALQLRSPAGGGLQAEAPWHEVGSLAFSADGATLVSGGRRDGTVRLADRAGRLLRTLKLGAPGRASPAHVALSPDGRTLLVSAETDLPATPRVYDMDGRRLGRFAGTGSQVIASALDPTGQVVVTTMLDGQVRLFSLDGRLLRRFPAQDEYPDVVAVDPRGRFAITGSETLVAWSAEGKALARARLGRGYASALAFSPDGQVAYVGSSGGEIAVMPIGPGARPGRLRPLPGKAAVEALAVDPTGRFLAAAVGHRVVIVEKHGTARAAIAPARPWPGVSGMVRGLAFTPRGDALVVGYAQGLAVHDLDGRELRRVEVPNRFLSGRMALSPSGRWVATTLGHEVGIYDARTLALERRLRGHTGDVATLAFTADERHLVTGSLDGTLRVFSTGSWQSAALFASGDDWVIYTDDGYFDGSRRAAELLALVDGMEAFGVDQVALRLNRPDLIYRRIGLGSEAYLEHLERQALDRAARVGLGPPAAEAPALGAPTVRILGQDRLGDALELEIEATGAGADLRALQVWANGAPLLGAGGRPLDGRQARVHERVELAQGKNRIEVSASDRAGFESRRATVLAERAVQAPGRLFFVGLGVSRYRDAALDLHVAHRDPQLLADALRRGKGFSAVKSLVLTDAQVTRQALSRIAGFLSEAGVDDTVVLLASGHGARDPGALGTFLYVTHEADGADLAGTTLKLAELEEALAGVRARRRLLLLDACQSGDLDPAVLAAYQARAAASGLQVRSTSERKAPEALPPRAWLTTRDRYIYARLERRSGVAVFASSLGDEVSVESPQLGSGVFTAALLQSLATPGTDLDHDGWVSIDELEAAVKRRVSEITGGLQHPTIDRENPLQELRLPLSR